MPSFFQSIQLREPSQSILLTLSARDSRTDTQSHKPSNLTSRLSYGRLRVQPQHELVILWVDHFLGEIKVRQLPHGHHQRHVALTQLEHRSVFDGTTQQLLADQDPGLCRAILLVVPQDRALKKKNALFSRSLPLNPEARIKTW